MPQAKSAWRERSEGKTGILPVLKGSDVAVKIHNFHDSSQDGHCPRQPRRLSSIHLTRMPGRADSAAACSPWTIKDYNNLWHMYYLGTSNTMGGGKTPISPPSGPARRQAQGPHRKQVGGRTPPHRSGQAASRFLDRAAAMALGSLVTGGLRAVV
jgi:hypothetical protein